MRCLTPISLLAVILTVTAAMSAYPRQNAQKASGQSQQISEFLKRLKDERIQNLMESAGWTLLHDYKDKSRVDKALKTMTGFFEAIGKYERGERAPLENMGGVKAFKDKMAALLIEDDQAVRSFAVTILGIWGDRTYAEQIAKLLKTREQVDDDRVYERGRAAIALGLLGAKEYSADLAVLLKSQNNYDRIGAVLGLGWMEAKEHAEAIARLLNDDDQDVREVAAKTLEMMGETEFIKKR
jgi:HEAT repeat protein